jgi:hypothetical protein
MDAMLPDLPQRPPIAQAPVSVVLLALGATSDAAECVSAWKPYLATLARPFELLVVPLAKAATDAVLAEVRQIDVDPACGYGPALQLAFHATQYPLVVLTTADRQFPPAELKPLLDVIDHVDIAVGCRCVAPPPFWLRALGWIAGLLGRIAIGLYPSASHGTAGATPWRRRWLARWAFGVRLHDPESPFRLARREALARIVLQSRGPFALIEQLAKANHLEMILGEEPVAWTPLPVSPPEPVPFAEDARDLFHRPNFGPPELHVPAAEKREADPTTPPPVSS